MIVKMARFKILSRILVLCPFNVSEGKALFKRDVCVNIDFNVQHRVVGDANVNGK